ncbi:DinB family protein [Aquimarina sediminis]|uniref:DinB family protein n=1 Tax=Aquimarina sediminis TaxID=2070536 RepID=UPI000CA0257C|nr:DinB family protein [Aquimarina sediminis]
MKQIKWFDRKFDFSFTQNIFPSIIERLKGTSLRLEHKIAQTPSDQLCVKPEGTWSIQENIGHLIDLEPIWQGRLEDILNDEKYLRAADLENNKTNFARHNDKEVNDLIKEFVSIRALTLSKLEKVSEKEIFKYVLHPRLETPMRTMDLFLFVAEHDDHHLARINELNALLTTTSKH